MADWDDDSQQARNNLRQVIGQVRKDARERKVPGVDDALNWHRAMMHGLKSPGPEFIGKFRGEPGLEGCEVEVAGVRGVASNCVMEELERFANTLQQAVKTLDGLIEPDQELNADDVAAVINLCAWVHAQWVRIHPFANGNGRTARLWANSIAIRYGLPPFVRLRPRPDGGYGDISARAMHDDWQAGVGVFKAMYHHAIRQ